MPERRNVVSASTTFILRPSDIFAKFLHLRGSDELHYQCGMLAMALEILTLIKTFEALPAVSQQAREETVSSLRTLLVDLDLDDHAEVWYERLNEWRKPKLLPVADVPDELLHGDAAVALVSSLRSSLPASVPASPAESEPRKLGSPVGPGTYQSSDPPSSSSERPAVGADEAMHSE
jgi:hypothetical protein